MFKATAFLVLLAVQAFAETQPIREVTSQAVLLGGQPIPRIYEGYVFFIDSRRNHIRIYALDGQLFLQTDVQDTSRPSVMSIAVDKDGTVAASWAGFAADGKREDFGGARTNRRGTAGRCAGV